MRQKAILILIGALFAGLVLEIVLRIVPTPTATRTGQHVDLHVTSYPPNFSFRTATGWSLLNNVWHQSGESGFIPAASIEVAERALVLIGDSLVEQSMLVPEKRLAFVLETMTNDDPVYAFGFPGSSLFDYLERIRFARERFGLNRFLIVVERADVRQSVCSNGTYTDACFDSSGEVTRRTQPTRSVWRELLAQSASLQYFVGVLRLSKVKLLDMFSKGGAPVALMPSIPERKVSHYPVLGDDKEAALQGFLSELIGLRADGVQVALLIDPVISDLDREEIFVEAELERLYVDARRLAIPVVHPLAAMQQFRKTTGLELHVGPYDAHWNVWANCVIALEISGLPSVRARSDMERYRRQCPRVAESIHPQGVVE